MGLESIPDYTFTEANYRARDDDDYPSALVSISFEVDGIAFFAELKLYLMRPEFAPPDFKVHVAGSYGHSISTVAGVEASGILGSLWGTTGGFEDSDHRGCDSSCVSVALCDNPKSDCRVSWTHMVAIEARSGRTTGSSVHQRL